jgi:hypothetical protein
MRKQHPGSFSIGSGSDHEASWQSARLVCHNVIGDARLYLVLGRYDDDLAAALRAAGCESCGGRLDRSAYPRKPWVPKTVELPDGYDERLSFSCATRTCRKRHTPPSTRFLGRRLYLGAIVVIAAAMQQGPTPWRSRRLRELFGVSRRTLARWRTWWTEVFAESTFWKAAKAAFSPPVSTAAPRSLLGRFAGDPVEQLGALLRLLGPLSTTTGYLPDRRR